MTTVTDVIAAGSNDGHDTGNGSGWDGTSTIVNAPRQYGTSERVAGFRFSAVDIAAGVTVDDATFKLYHVYGQCYSHWYVDVGGSADEPDFSSSDTPTNISKSTAKLTVFLNGDSSLDVDAHVTEMIALGGWAADQAMRFAGFRDTAYGNYNIQWASYEHTSTAPAKLVINYTAAAGGIEVLRRRIEGA